MAKIKDNAQHKQAEITETLENTLKEMYDYVKRKTDFLKSDQHELKREF